MKSLGFLGKLMYAGPMAMFGIFHLMGADDMKGMVPDFLPAPVFFVYLTGIALLLAAVAIIIGKKAKLAAQLLGLMLALFAVLIHLSGFMSQDPISSSMFLKDIALAGGAWFMSAHLSD
ncbi:DoxX family protein [Ekhidna sp.]|uniref:DoxX family membrane protein n=1 Tax=Ekhidna sp. TaxID=2608089 RepID=UPI00329941F9